MAAEGGPPLVLVDLALDYGSATRVALAAADQASPDDLARAAGLFQALGKEVSRIDDVPGMLVMRTVCMLANEAADAVNQGVCDAAAVDTAMRLAVNYPKGPLAWAEAIGLRPRDHRARQPRRRLRRGPLSHLAAPAPPPARGRAPRMSADDLARRSAEAMFERDRACQGLGMVIEEVREGYARLRMTVRADMLNGHGACHGGFIFALANSAFAFSCNSRNRATVAAGADIEYLAPGRDGDVLVAEGRGALAGRPARRLRHHRPAPGRQHRGPVPRPLLRPQGERDRRAAAAMRDAFICDAIRTPVGRYGGSLAGIRADDLGAIPIRELVRRNAGRWTGPRSTT